MNQHICHPILYQNPLLLLNRPPSSSCRHTIVATFTPVPRVARYDHSRVLTLSCAITLCLYRYFAVVRLASARLPAVAATRTLAAPVRAFSEAAAAPPASPDVVVPECVDSLEWVLDSPPTLHQFDEPPIVVEIAHLMN